MIDFLTVVLFESLPWLLVFCAIAFAVALGVHRRRLTPGTRRGLWITLDVCLGLIIVQRLVVTDREALAQVIRAMARAVDSGDVAAMEEHIADDMQWRSGGKQQFLADVTSRLTATQVNEARISQVRAAVESDTATVTFQAVCDLKDNSFDQANVVSHWKLRFVRPAGRWVMDRILDARIYAGGLPTSGGIDLMPLIR